MTNCLSREHRALRSRLRKDYGVEPNEQMVAAILMAQDHHWPVLSDEERAEAKRKQDARRARKSRRKPEMMAPVDYD